MMSNIALAAGLMIPMVLVGWNQPETKPQPQNQPPAKKEVLPGQPKQPDSVSMQEDTAFRDTLAAQEKRIWESMKAGDWKAVEAMSSDRFVMVCPSGIENKREAMEKGKNHKLTSYTLSEWKSIKLDNNTGLIMYKGECSMTPGEGGSDKQVAYHTTLWRRDGSNWLAEMHQATKEEGPAR